MQIGGYLRTWCATYLEKGSFDISGTVGSMNERRAMPGSVWLSTGSDYEGRNMIKNRINDVQSW
jgi:hypothetical protein